MRTLILLAFVIGVSQPVCAAERKSDSWVDRDVVVLSGTPLRMGTRVAVKAENQWLFRVELERGELLWIVCGSNRGWVKTGDVLPFDRAVAYYTQGIEPELGPRQATAWRDALKRARERPYPTVTGSWTHMLGGSGIRNGPDPLLQRWSDGWIIAVDRRKERCLQERHLSGVVMIADWSDGLRTWYFRPDLRRLDAKARQCVVASEDKERADRDLLKASLDLIARDEPSPLGGGLGGTASQTQVGDPGVFVPYEDSTLKYWDGSTTWHRTLRSYRGGLGSNTLSGPFPGERPPVRP